MSRQVLERNETGCVTVILFYRYHTMSIEGATHTCIYDELPLNFFSPNCFTMHLFKVLHNRIEPKTMWSQSKLLNHTSMLRPILHIKDLTLFYLSLKTGRELNICDWRIDKQFNTLTANSFHGNKTSIYTHIITSSFSLSIYYIIS